MSFDTLPAYQQRMLRQTWEAGQFYGEPEPARYVRQFHALNKLASLGLVYASRYQGQPCYGITQAGKDVYLNSVTYADNVKARPSYAKPGV